MGYSFTIETAEPTAADLIVFIKQHNIKTITHIWGQTPNVRYGAIYA